MALGVASQAMQAADHPFEYLIAIDDDDPERIAYEASFNNLPLPHARLLVGQSRNCVQAINLAAAASTGDVLVVVSDDFELPPHWDTLILEATEGKREWLLKTWDGQEPWIATLPTMDRTLYERLGYIYHPAYVHMFADTHLSSLCDYLGVTLYRLDIHIPHWHYSTAKNPKDALNVRADSTFAHGMQIYLDHHRNNYGLSSDDIKGGITHEPHLQWLKQRLGQ
jgi:glycosyltransferase involved in cell wall biosynthesis